MIWVGGLDGGFQHLHYKILLLWLFSCRWFESQHLDYLHEAEARLQEVNALPGPVFTVGLSMGGAVSLALAALHPDKIAKTAIFSPLLKVLCLHLEKCVIIFSLENEPFGKLGTWKICYNFLPVNPILWESGTWRTCHNFLPGKPTPLRIRNFEFSIANWVLGFSTSLNFKTCAIFEPMFSVF